MQLIDAISQSAAENGATVAVPVQNAARVNA